ncbi:hypothetical protein [Pacificoceanicola onchidii]|uniref:hypothetical protein n=1 Tax=Pacificoceanicola onchidii TaxID=2562685 RepID=UPI0010A531AF|nr:hypothetical protein [Pacificoceanicola onchidii]
MKDNAYTRAVDSFEALIAAPQQALHATPAGLFNAAGIPASSGYRHVAALEAEGLLRRDAGGGYLPGLTALRTGFHGFGLGRLAPMAQPILVQLRQSTQHTAFVAVVEDMDLTMGPHSIGRESQKTQISHNYSFDAIPDFTLGAVSEVALRSVSEGIARRTAALVVPVMSTERFIVLVGLLLNPRRSVPQNLEGALAHAAEQIVASGADD